MLKRQDRAFSKSLDWFEDEEEYEGRGRILAGVAGVGAWSR
jgi:hypothetical protein